MFSISFIPEKDENREKVWSWINDPANKYLREALWCRLNKEQKEHLLNELRKEQIRKKTIETLKSVAMYAAIFGAIVALSILAAAVSDEE